MKWIKDYWASSIVVVCAVAFLWPSISRADPGFSWTTGWTLTGAGPTNATFAGTGDVLSLITLADGTATEIHLTRQLTFTSTFLVDTPGPRFQAQYDTPGFTSAGNTVSLLQVTLSTSVSSGPFFTLDSTNNQFLDQTGQAGATAPKTTSFNATVTVDLMIDGSAWSQSATPMTVTFSTFNIT